ncbi:cysteine hydrolase [Ancylobacter sp. MQZ15Z-1]|uniref:Cysteine hydrolase n=1 Tax=Ancylobacter mangrovi TaxID=2972472 RepID=A0A9X2T418_9HYPH|nr:cysteine hydrolase [Ancylobacter mangrovi]MCS0494004.1 cysteine hydrolase [Ancylobacter mangrovi]
MTERRASAFHLCLDMQRLFSPRGAWANAWMAGVLPNIAAICESFAGRTVFTRFIPAPHPDAEIGTWRGYYRRWSTLTLEEIDADELAIVDELRPYASRAPVADKRRFSAFAAPALAPILNGAHADTLVVTGGETDMCVLATVLEAIDRGYRVLVVEDAVCSSSDPGHEAALTIYRNRFAEQLGLVTTRELVEQVAARAL